MRNRVTVIGGIVAALLAIPAIVYGSHQFNDVASSDTFHQDIGWLADNGITKGCNPPTNDEFCPDDPVTRGQMAAFMKRFHDRFVDGSASQAIGLGFAWRSQSDTPSTGDGFVSDLSMTVDVPESGTLLVHATAETYADSVDSFACGISTNGSPGTAIEGSWRTIDLTTDWYDSCSTQTAIQVAPGSRHIALVISGANSDTLVTSGGVTAVLLTDSGSFGLLSVSQDEVEARELSDARKGD